jgi:hypothetical protein
MLLCCCKQWRTEVAIFTVMLFQAVIRNEVLVLFVYIFMMLQAAIITGTLLQAVAE